MPNAVARALLCLMPMLAVSAVSTPLHAADSGTLPARVETALQSAKIPSDAVALAVIPLEGQGMAQFINADTPVSGNMAGKMEIMGLPLRDAREIFEREYLMTQVTRFGGNISKTAKFIGMERSALHRKLKSLGMRNEEKQ